MKILSILLVAATFLIASCSNEKAADANETTNTATENTTAAPAINAPATGAAEVPATDPNMQMQPAQPAQQPANTTDGTVALNPAHGQPGHRCDIAVGAPLNSAPAQQPQTIQVQ